MTENEKKARKVLKENRVAVFIVAYNAEKHIQKVLERIPEWVSSELDEIFVIDDSSKDATSEKVREMSWGKDKAPLKIFRTPGNQGYGGNQKIGYSYAISRGFDIVVLLHGDGQYAPESLPEILAPYDDGYDAVFGSRFLIPRNALKGGMPLYKWVGNRILTRMQNRLLGSKMSEMHSGYRSYRVSSMAKIPFSYNAANFHFDAEIIVQFHDAGFRIKEVEIPTFYGDEICHVNGLLYAFNCIKTFIKYRLMQMEIFYDPKFDIRIEKPHVYFTKQTTTSLHHFVRNYDFGGRKKVLDVGGGDGEAVSQHLSKSHGVTCIDQYAEGNSKEISFVKADLNQSWSDEYGLKSFDTVLALDVIEHMNDPEKTVKEIFNAMSPGGTLLASTANIGYVVMRLMLALGIFNYGRRGILDLTHRRLFTISTFKRLLKSEGFEVKKVIGFGPPVADLKQGIILRMLDRISFVLARIWPRMFAFNFLVIATRKEGFKDICHLTTAKEVGDDGK